jgi:phosphoribosylaminoimidazole-succinocarboxamide synthase|tara:strand:+ start:7304 stop:8251 length:948 start_codon:yes stop_codon:yes gene_type:complete
MSIVLNKSDFLFKNQLSKYEGKVREVYTLKNDIMIMIASDRISAFDVVMPRGITFKGQVLNQIAVEMLNRTNDIVQNWLIENPDPNVSIGKKCNPLKVEMVVRGYLSGHAYREYKAGKRNLCGNKIPNGLKENEKFENPIITPTTKADKGLHDQDIDPVDIIKQNIVSKSDYEKIHQISLDLYKRGSKIANDNGLILVDTKYEFGYDSNGDITLIDEIHTPDSSRYFYLNTYDELFNKNQKQKQLSKEFFREWLMKNNFRGLEGQTIPEISDDVVEMVSSRYIELYEKLLGEKFIKPKSNNVLNRIKENLKDYLF